MNVNEKEASTVRSIFEWYTKEGDGTHKIAQKLNTMSISTKRGCKWTQTAVSRILSNALYTGKVINGKQEIVNFPESNRKKKDPADYIIIQNEDLRIISDKMFESAQSILHKRQNMFQLNNTRHSNKYLFSTLIKCKECGWSFRRVVKTYKNTYIRWVCSGRNGHGRDACENAISIDEEILFNEL